MMMKTTTPDQIQSIIDAIDIIPGQNKICNNNNGKYYDYPETLPNRQNPLVETLAQIIYSDFYINEDDVAEKTVPQLNSTATAYFRTALSKANTSAERFEGGWIVYGVENGSNFYVQKGNVKRPIFAGEFIFENYKNTAASEGDAVQIHQYREVSNKQSPFYFVFGETVDSDNVEMQTRFYFNLKPEGSEKLIYFLTQNLNKYQVPFQFKCLSDPALYCRTDSAVLYIDKKYFQLIMFLMDDLIDVLDGSLKPGIPLFTKKIAEGIAFAESPASSAESFGTNRAKIIAQGIFNAISSQKPKDQWIDLVVATAEKMNYSVEHFYLNPNTNYPYSFKFKS